MIQITVIRSNSIVHSPRVGKIVNSLRKEYSVSALGWNRDGITDETINKYFVRLKLLSLNAPFGKPSLVAYFPLYWTWILIQLFFVYRPLVVHACDLDSAIPSYLYKVISRKKLVFDVCDRYAMGYIPPKFKRLYSMVNSLEEFIGKRSDVLINVSEKLQGTFGKRPKHCSVVMNCSEDQTTNVIKKTQLDSENLFTVAYTGNIIKTRGLAETASAIKELEGVRFAIAGRPIDNVLLNKLLQIPNVRYHGLLQPKDALALQARSDVIISLYDLVDPISYFSMGNKIFEAMMFGLPVVTNVASEIINKEQCGMLVRYDDLAQLKETLITLRDNPELRKRLGKNGRKAFMQKYNWNAMERELLNLYGKLLRSR